MRLLTRDLPGTGGLHKASPEDFIVDELPAYAPSGEGAHTFVHFEKRALTTAEAVNRLCRALDVSQKDAGVAGQKDRQALTRQWISLPGVDPALALAATVDGIRVLEAVRHPHKLRTGHLAGNRFTLTLRGVGAAALERAQAILDRLATVGLPNYFGQQRFGVRGDNAARGKSLLAPPTPGDATRRPRIPGTERRMLVSAYQAELFNRYLDARIDDDLVGTALVGDVLKKTDTGGLFTADEVAIADAQARLAAHAVVVTGPMYGHKMMSPPPGTPSRAREDAILSGEFDDGVGAEAFKVMGKLAEGTRRPLVVPLGAPSVRPADDDALILEFALPSGSYATVLLAEVVK
jgi:tRNA pseudouridine13 synthase